MLCRDCYITVRTGVYQLPSNANTCPTCHTNNCYGACCIYCSKENNICSMCGVQVVEYDRSEAIKIAEQRLAQREERFGFVSSSESESSDSPSSSCPSSPSLPQEIYPSVDTTEDESSDSDSESEDEPEDEDCDNQENNDRCYINMSSLSMRGVVPFFFGVFMAGSCFFTFPEYFNEHTIYNVGLWFANMTTF